MFALLHKILPRIQRSFHTHKYSERENFRVCLILDCPCVTERCSHFAGGLPEICGETLDYPPQKKQQGGD